MALKAGGLVMSPRMVSHVAPAIAARAIKFEIIERPHREQFCGARSESKPCASTGQGYHNPKE